MYYLYVCFVLDPSEVHTFDDIEPSIIRQVITLTKYFLNCPIFTPNYFKYATRYLNLCKTCFTKTQFNIICVFQINVVSKFNEIKTTMNIIYFAYVQSGIPPKSKVINWSPDKLQIVYFKDKSVKSDMLPPNSILYARIKYPPQFSN